MSGKLKKRKVIDYILVPFLLAGSLICLYNLVTFAFYLLYLSPIIYLCYLGFKRLYRRYENIGPSLGLSEKVPVFTVSGKSIFDSDFLIVENDRIGIYDSDGKEYKLSLKLSDVKSVEYGELKYGGTRFRINHSDGGSKIYTLGARIIKGKTMQNAVEESVSIGTAAGNLPPGNIYGSRVGGLVGKEFMQLRQEEFIRTLRGIGIDVIKSDDRDLNTFDVKERLMIMAVFLLIVGVILTFVIVIRVLNF